MIPGSKCKVYVAGPYSSGDSVLNVRRAIKTADQLLFHGFAPFLPHLAMLWHAVSPKPYPDWLALDNEWLAACNALLRIPGESRGSDLEVITAGDLGIPVFTGISDLLLWRDTDWNWPGI